MEGSERCARKAVFKAADLDLKHNRISTTCGNVMTCSICRVTSANILEAWSSARDTLPKLFPIEQASMDGRAVVQWDKDDCSDGRIIKIDFLDLGGTPRSERNPISCPAVLRRAARLRAAPRGQAGL